MQLKGVDSVTNDLPDKCGCKASPELCALLLVFMGLHRVGRQACLEVGWSGDQSLNSLLDLCCPSHPAGI